MQQLTTTREERGKMIADKGNQIQKVKDNQIAQVNELLAKIIAYNLTVVIHEMYENGISPDFLHVKSDVCT
jgi:hypothetical protein